MLLQIIQTGNGLQTVLLWKTDIFHDVKETKLTKCMYCSSRKTLKVLSFTGRILEEMQTLTKILNKSLKCAVPWRLEIRNIFSIDKLKILNIEYFSVGQNDFVEIS